MHDELTSVDLKKLREELEYRETVLQPKILEDVKTARGFGDLSENFEYKAAKQEKIRTESRMRYLRNMISTAVVVDPESGEDEIGLFDEVTLYFEEDDEEQTIRLVTTLRQNALKGLISTKSPLGGAILGRHVGDRVKIHVSDDYSYFVTVRDIRKGEDDASLEIARF